MTINAKGLSPGPIAFSFAVVTDLHWVERVLESPEREERLKRKILTEVQVVIDVEPVTGLLAERIEENINPLILSRWEWVETVLAVVRRTTIAKLGAVAAEPTLNFRVEVDDHIEDATAQGDKRDCTENRCRDNSAINRTAKPVEGILVPLFCHTPQRAGLSKLRRPSTLEKAI